MEVTMAEESVPDLTKQRQIAATILSTQLGKSIDLQAEGTKVLDMDGSLLFVRFPFISQGSKRRGFADLTWREELGTPLLSWAERFDWNEADIVAQSREAAKAAAGRDGKQLVEESPQFIAYNFPHLALRFALVGGNFIYIDATNRKRVADGAPDDDGLRGRSDLSAGLAFSLAGIKDQNKEIYDAQIRLLDAQPSGGAADEEMTIDWRCKGQKIDVPYFPEKSIDDNWCVPACIQMVLAFYRYHYTQEEIAQGLGLASPVYPPLGGLVDGHEFKVLRAIEHLTDDALDVEMSVYYHSLWRRLREEVNAQRPSIVLNGAHALVAKGWCEETIPGSKYPVRRLLLLDPDKPHACELWVEVDQFQPHAAFFARLRGLDRADRQAEMNSKL
jgi:hypothetical protein